MADLLEKLEERARARGNSPRPRGAGVQLFMAQKESIEQAIEARYPYIEIYEALTEEGSMSITYRSFCTYVWRFITTKKENNRKRKGGSQPITSDLSQKNKNSMDNYSPVADVSLVKRKEPNKEKERLPRGLGGSSSISAQRKGSEQPEDFPDSPIFGSEPKEPIVAEAPEKKGFNHKKVPDRSLFE